MPVMTPILIHWFIILAPIISVIIAIAYPFRWSPWKRIKKPDNDIFSPSKKIPVPHYDSTYPFACGPASIQMLSERLWIAISQEKIAELNGSKKVGTSPWEATKLLNKIFSLHHVHYRARISSYTSFTTIYEKLCSWEPVFAMFMIRFHEEGFSKNAYFPHFGLITQIEKNTITIQSPVYKRNHWENVQGELILPIDTFLQNFYIYPSVIKQLEFKPTHVKNIFLRIRHAYLNFGFIFYVFAAYYLGVLKPGISIQIQ